MPSVTANSVAMLLVSAFLCLPVHAEPATCGIDRSPAYDRFDELSARERSGLARTLAQDGDYDAAIREYRRLSEQYPENVDYVFGEAQVRFWSGEHECALQLVSRARQLAPDYEDVWKLEYRALRAVHEPAGGERLAAFRAAAGARFPGAAWFSDSDSREGPTWRWETGINRESLDNGAADWQNLYAYVHRQTPNDSLLSLKLTEHSRFSRTDTEIAVGGGFAAWESWRLDGALSVTPDADFLPAVVIDAGASRQLGNGWLAGAHLRNRNYADDTVNTLGLNVEHYFGSFRAAYYLDNTRLASSSSFTHRGVLNYWSQSGSRYGFTVAVGDEVEVIAPERLLEMDIAAFAITGRHPLGKHLSILWRLGTHRQGSIYRRNHAGLSIAGEF